MCQCRSYGHFDLFGGALAHIHAMYLLHVVHDILCQVIAGYIDTFVADDAAERDHGDLGCAATYVDNHVTFGGLYVKPDAESGSHRLVDHIDIASVGLFR
jgi:hypothetical protein